MTFARRVFFWSGIYGIVSLVPQYFLERKIGQDLPPPITHPEYFYGFVGVALAWQLAFFVISTDPVRFRPLMIPAFLEKLSFFAAAVVLFTLDRVPLFLMGIVCFDFSLGLLFLVSYRHCRPT
jgi:hypothetical protein